MAIEFAFITLAAISVSLITITYKKNKNISKKNNYPIIMNYREYPEIRI